jgi:hypothetical protein
MAENEIEPWLSRLRGTESLNPASSSGESRANLTSSKQGAETELFPIWLQKSLGPWTMFGGGGYTNNPGPRNKNFANYGIALQRQVLSNLALGVEVFGQGPDTTADHGSAAVSVGAIFDFDDLWHFVGSANTGISNAGADQFSFNLAFKWTP